MDSIRSHRDLRVYQGAFAIAMKIFEVTKRFPIEERYSMVDQIRRSSRSVCANLAESWRKRRYPAHFVAKLSDAESEANETRVWLEFALSCKYITQEEFDEFDPRYDLILGQLVKMISEPEKWKINK